MALARTLLARRFHSLIHPQNVSFFSHILIHPNPPSPSPHRTFASSSQALADSGPIHAFKSLHSLFQEAPQQRIDPKNDKLKGKSKKDETLSLSENTADKESKVGSFKSVNNKKKKKKPQKKSREITESKVNFVEDEVQGKTKQDKAVNLSEETEHEKCEVQCQEGKKKKLGKKLKKPKKSKVKFIEEEEVVVKVEQQKKPEPKRTLYDIFDLGEKSNEANPRRLSPVIAAIETHKEVKQRERPDLKKLSKDMETFLSYLYKEGYFNDANFNKGKGFDLSWFDVENARNYALFAAQKFGKDKQEISKWLSGSDLKQVAMLGCPSAIRAQVFPSKRLRYYFKIPENTVCGECVLRDSCKFANQAVWRTDNNLDLALAMKVICSYAMSIVHPQLVVPEKVNNSVNRLLKEVLKLSQTL